MSRLLVAKAGLQVDREGEQAVDGHYDQGGIGKVKVDLWLNLHDLAPGEDHHHCRRYQQEIADDSQVSYDRHSTERRIGNLS